MDRYLELLQNALDAVVGIDVDQRIIFWNYQAEQTFGWKSGEVLGKDMAMIIVPEGFRDGHRRGMAHYLETGEGPILNRRIEVPALKKDGTQFSCELTVTVMKQEGVTRFYSFLRDISDRKQLELEKTRLLAEANRAIKTRDEFFSICSHELKTPVTSILLQLQLAEKDIAAAKGNSSDSNPLSNRMERVIRQVKRIHRLIDDMLDISRIEAGKLHYAPTVFDFHSLVRELAVRFESQGDGTCVDVDLDQGNEVVSIKADYDRIDQVLTNLVTNSIKYGDGQYVRIKTRINDGSLQISVIDRGKGIEAENLERIFQKFERGISHDNISGLGIGLYVSRSIILAHGGKISVKSQPGEGSEFMFHLPVHRP